MNPAMKKGAALSILVGVILLAAAAIAGAQQPKKIPRIGFLGTTATSNDLKVIRERLRELGYMEGQNIAIEHRSFDGKVERLPELAAELVRLHCDVIVTSGTEAAVAAKNATKTIPVVMAFGADAVRRGIVADLARPGGNITGLTNIGAELNGKRLELLKEVTPKLSRVAFLWSSTDLDAVYYVKETEAVGKSLRLGIQSLEVKEPAGIEGAFQVASKHRAEAIMVGPGGFFAAHRKKIIELAAKGRFPAMYGNTGYVDAGGLMAYAAYRLEQYRRAAEYVDKVLKGTKPSDLPVERPKKFEFVVNLKTAKQIGLAIPQWTLMKADRVIK
jgi:putative ABC transport system substrate-binding protein